MRGLPIVVATLLLLPMARVTSAQGEIGGRVLAADSGRPPVAGVEVSTTRTRLKVITDSSGRFFLKNVPAGEHLVVLRAIGFRAESSMVMVDRDESVSMEVVLDRAPGTMLPERVVEAPEARAPAKLVEFSERQKLGTGHFITRDQLAKAEGGLRQTGDIISLIPGVRVRRGSNKIWIATARAIGAGCAFCAPPALHPVDRAAGARPACFMDVYLDGLLVFDSRYPGNGLFDVNAIQPEHISGIEVYTSAAQIPAKYNRAANGCGVLLIWLR